MPPLFRRRLRSYALFLDSPRRIINNLRRIFPVKCHEMLTFDRMCRHRMEGFVTAENMAEFDNCVVVSISWPQCWQLRQPKQERMHFPGYEGHFLRLFPQFAEEQLSLLTDMWCYFTTVFVFVLSRCVYNKLEQRNIIVVRYYNSCLLPMIKIMIRHQLCSAPLVLSPRHSPLFMSNELLFTLTR